MQSHPNLDFSSVSSLKYLEQKDNEFKIKGYKIIFGLFRSNLNLLFVEHLKLYKPLKFRRTQTASQAEARFW